MKSELLTLESALDEIAELIQSYQSAEELHAHVASTGETHPDIVQAATALAQKRTFQRKYQYVSVIIALYGAMEQYVEALILSYLRLLPIICGRFDNIPEDIRHKHHELTVEYLTAIKQNRVHEPEDVGVIVRRLAQCRVRAVRYELNSRAFALRTANMSFDRMKTLADNMKVQVTPRRLINTPSFVEYYTQKNGLSMPAMRDVEARAAFSSIDDLVMRRNRIAHGANSVDDIEDYPLLRDRVDHLRMYGRALYEVFEDHALRMCAQKNRMENLGMPLHRYRGNIVCFQLDQGCVSVGDVVVMLPTDEHVPARRGGVLSLQIETLPYQNIVGTPGCSFGAKLPYNPSETASYGVLRPDIASALDL